MEKNENLKTSEKTIKKSIDVLKKVVLDTCHAGSMQYFNLILIKEFSYS